jgi:hypothetical protein
VRRERGSPNDDEITDERGEHRDDQAAGKRILHVGLRQTAQQIRH